MTALVNTLTDALQNSTLTSIQPQSNLLSVPPLESLTKSIIHTLPQLETKSSALLKKRHNSANLEDLCVKKIKTQSTNCSDSESFYHSISTNRKTSSKTFPSLSRSGSFESVEKDDGFLLEEDFSTEGLTLVDQASIGVFDIPPLANPFSFANPKHENLIEDGPEIPPLLLTNSNSLQHSLEILKNQLIIFQFKDFLLQNFFQEQAPEPVRIPPLFLPSVENEGISSLDLLREQQVSKRIPKEIEEEMCITYGTVEFPLLSMINNNNTQTNKGLNPTGALSQLNVNSFSNKTEDPSQSVLTNKRKYTKLNPVFKITRDSQENTKQGVKAKKKEIKAIKTTKKVIERVEKKVVVEEKKIKPTKKLSPVKNLNIQSQKNISKKTGKDGAKSPMEIEEPAQQASKRKSAYFSFNFVKRRGEERKKNRWQVSQDIKLGDLQIPILNLSNNYSFMFEGNKKKSSLIAVGCEYQVDMDYYLQKTKENNPRQPKLKWDPSSHQDSEMQRFFKEVETITDTETNQEKMIKYLLRNQNDIRKAKKYIKENKLKVSQDLIIKALD